MYDKTLVIDGLRDIEEIINIPILIGKKLRT